jgi:uncharacterized phiE125 gp8 family phage protein
MKSSIRVTTQPTAEPLSIAEARAHMRVDHFDEDGVIAGLILAARQHIETICGMALCSTGYTMTLDDFPPGEMITLPREPVQSVTAVRYLNEAGSLVTWSSAEWEADLYSLPPRIRPRDGYTWPISQDRFAAVEIEFVAGYGGPDLVPQAVMQAMRLLVGHFYEHREAVQSGGSVVELPFAVDALLAPYRRYL